MLKRWINNWLNGDRSEKLVIADDENILSGLNLKEVLDAHDAWKKKLQDELTGDGTESLDVPHVASDRNCVLGKWLHGTGKKKYAKMPEYHNAVKAHANFHICAAEVVIEHQSGNTEKARELLETKFRAASNDNQLELVRLFSASKEL